MIAQRARYCVGSLDPEEQALDVQYSMLDGPRGWVEGDLLLTASRAVFRPRKGPLNWSVTMPHEAMLRLDEISRSRYSPASRVYVLHLQNSPLGYLEIRIDTSPKFVEGWRSWLALNE